MSTLASGYPQLSQGSVSLGLVAEGKALGVPRGQWGEWDFVGCLVGPQDYMRMWRSLKLLEPIIPFHFFIHPSIDFMNILHQALGKMPETSMHWT